MSHLPKTNCSPPKIGHLKRTFHLPTMDFQGRKKLVAGCFREGMPSRISQKEYAQCENMWHIQSKPPSSSHQLTIGWPFISVCSENMTLGTRKGISPKNKRRSNIRVSKWGTFPNPVEMVKFCRKPPVVGSGILRLMTSLLVISNLTMDYEFWSGVAI